MADFPPLPTTSLATLCDMFPTMQKSVVEMVLENAQGNGEKAIELLLTMSEPVQTIGPVPVPPLEPEPCKASLSQVSATLLSPRSSSIASPTVNQIPPPSLFSCPALSDVQDGHHVMVILRGLPGSGKSSLAEKIIKTAQQGISFSTDEFFIKRGVFTFKPELLGDAHAWNQRRAKDAVKDKRVLVVIDNTNTMAWEMRPYVELGLNNNYKVHIMEPNTDWKFKPKVLALKNSHNVPKQKIEIMLDRYEKDITIEKLKNMWNISENEKAVNVGKQDEEIFESEDESVTEHCETLGDDKTKLNPDVKEFVPSRSCLQDGGRSNNFTMQDRDSPPSYKEREGNDVERLTTMFPHLSMEQASTLYNQHGQNTTKVISSLLEEVSPAEEVMMVPQTLSEEETSVPMTLDPMFAVTLQEKFGSPVDDSLLQFLNTGEVLSLDIPASVAREIFTLWQGSLQKILTTKPVLQLPGEEGNRFAASGGTGVSDWGGGGAGGSVPPPPRTVLAPNAVEHYEKQMLDKAMKASMSQNTPRKAKPVIVVKPMKQEQEKVEEQRETTELEQFIEQRNMLYRKAMETRGSNMQGAASYYAAQARDLNAHIKTTQKQSQMEMFLRANKDSPSMKLDLHYLQTSDAIKQLQQFISQKEAMARSCNSGNQTVDIITGKELKESSGRNKEIDHTDSLLENYRAKRGRGFRI